MKVRERLFFFGEIERDLKGKRKSKIRIFK